MAHSLKSLLQSVAAVGAMITLLTGMAFSQAITLPTNKKEPRSAEDLEREKALERDYKRKESHRSVGEHPSKPAHSA